MAKRYFWDTAPSKNLRNQLSWSHSGDHGFSAIRARILLVQSETDFNFHGPSLNKFSIGPAKMRILVRREQVSTATSQITDKIREVTSDRVLSQVASKVSGKLSAGAPGNTISIGPEFLSKDEYEVTHTAETELSQMMSHSFSETTGREHEMTLESADGERIAEERRRYKQVTWDFYLHSCDYLELEYDRRWYWPKIKRSFKAPVSKRIGWPLVRLVFYVPQPEMDIRWEGDAKQIVDFPHKIKVEALSASMPDEPPPSVDNLEKLARLAFPSTKEEKRAAIDYQRSVKRAAKKAPTRHFGAPAKKAVAKKAVARKAVAKKAMAKKAVAKKTVAKKAAFRR